VYKFAMLLTVTVLSSGVAVAATPHTAVRAILTPDLSGTYLLDPSRSDNPGQAVDAAIGSMRRFKRNAVKKRLNGEMKPADTLSVAVHGDTVTLTTSGRLHLTTVPGGPVKSRTGQKGGSAQLASSWEGDTLVVKTTSEKFQREARYSRDSDGSSIRVAITMSGSGSANPIHYTLVYRRLTS
jgi:hypothetical protein